MLLTLAFLSIVQQIMGIYTFYGQALKMKNTLRITYLIGFVLLTLSSCTEKCQKDYIEEFVIIGHSGWCFKDSANWIFDSTKFDVREYFEYKRNSFVRIAKRRPSRDTEFYSISANDTIGFGKLITNILLNQKFKTEYFREENNTGIYDGWNYLLYYKLKSNKEFIIKYYPHHLPDSLKLIHNYIDSIINLKDIKTSESFEFNKATSILAVEQFMTHPPPPAPRENTIKFTPPVVKEDNNQE